MYVHLWDLYRDRLEYCSLVFVYGADGRDKGGMEGRKVSVKVSSVPHHWLNVH